MRRARVLGKNPQTFAKPRDVLDGILTEIAAPGGGRARVASTTVE
jgi:hypothetical protein